jgi:S-adenosylmethionine hydrolase
MLTRPIITLTTDFGQKDPFAGIMKGVILGINPDAEIIDISHNVRPQNIIEASQILSVSYKYFPSRTIHIAVVDPGVGGSRRPLLVVAENHFFIGPDNGVFSHILKREESDLFRVIHMTARHHFLSVKGPTFHGRDIFASAAAWLSRGIDSSKFGELIHDYVVLPISGIEFIDNSTITGEVTYIDGFGNAITNITKDNLESVCKNNDIDTLTVIFNEKKLDISHYYEEKTDSALRAIINSFEFLELFIYRGNASAEHGIQIGDKVSVTAK